MPAAIPSLRTSVILLFFKEWDRAIASTGKERLVLREPPSAPEQTDYCCCVAPIGASCNQEEILFTPAEQLDAAPGTRCGGCPRPSEDGDFVIDVGAFSGSYTALLSRLVGRTGEVWSIEPVPDTFRILSYCVASSNLENVRLFNLALSDSCGT